MHKLWETDLIIGQKGMKLNNTYLDVLPELRTAALDLFNESGTRSPARVLWAIMLALQTKRMRSGTKKRIVFCDNFYTSINIARKVNQFSENEIHMRGTVRLRNIDEM